MKTIKFELPKTEHSDYSERTQRLMLGCDPDEWAKQMNEAVVKATVDKIVEAINETN